MSGRSKRESHIRDRKLERWGRVYLIFSVLSFKLKIKNNMKYPNFLRKITIKFSHCLSYQIYEKSTRHLGSY